jgi:aldehyde:ferredoxin oxidoreductase
MKGYAGNILRVDLSKAKVNSEPIKREWTEMFVGGKGLAARYLFEELKPNTDSLSPDNVLIFMTGPILAVDPQPAGFSKGVVVTKSPATNTFLDSFFGGNFHAQMKLAGFDGIIIHGRAKRLSYLFLENGDAKIQEVENLRGKGVYETTEFLQKETGIKDLKVAAIGPAGENLVKFACISFERHHQAGRGGAGAVMGSKNLKAVAARGTGKIEVHDPEAFKEFVRETTKNEIMGPAHEDTRKIGTPGYLAMCNEAGILPTRNFQDGVFEFAENIGWDAIKKNIFLKKNACYRCALACRNVTSIRSGPYKGLTIEGPEYETLALAGSNCGIGDLEAIVRFNYLCDDLGLDTISTGNVTAFAMECYEKGLISKEETDGLDLSFGSVAGYLAIPELIAHRKRIGGVLAEGVRGASERISKGSEQIALQVKGLELPGYDPRGTVGMALAYATSDRGACHMKAWPVAYDAFGELDPFVTEGKAQLVINDQHFNAIKFSFIGCDFYGIDYPTMARFYYLVTGREVDEEKLKLMGERIWNLTRAFNVREGFSRKDDTNPHRIAKDPVISGPAKGRVVTMEDFEEMLDEYYKLRGWTKEGIPTRKKLEELGLAEIADKLGL